MKRSAVCALWGTCVSKDAVGFAAMTSSSDLPCETSIATRSRTTRDRKSTRLNSSHLVISYAVFCLKKKKTKNIVTFCQNTIAIFWHTYWERYNRHSLVLRRSILHTNFATLSPLGIRYSHIDSARHS